MAEHWVKYGADGNVQQRVILLGDRHTYYSEYVPEVHESLSLIKDREQQDVIDLARNMQATILVEDFCSSWWHVPRSAILKLFRADWQDDVATYLWGLGNKAREAGVLCENIEARNPVSVSGLVGGFHAVVFFLVMRVVQEASVQNIATLREIFIDHTKKWLSYGAFVVTTTGFPMLMVWLEQRRMDQRIASLPCALALKLYISMIKKSLYAETSTVMDTSRYSWMVDLRATLLVLENPFKNYIICAGCAHTSNIATFLAAQGYSCIKYLESPYLDKSSLEHVVDLTEVLSIPDILL